MNKRFWITFLLILGLGGLNASTWIESAEDITEEWLIEAGMKSGYTEHVRHFKRIFETAEVRTLLEFGVGFSTKYFMDHCQEVVSVEFVTPGTGPEWLKYCINLYRNYPTWTPIAYFAGNVSDIAWAKNRYMGIESVYKAASYQPVYRKSYADIDPTYLLDIRQFIDEQVAASPVDVAFVDCGICIRGDLVQELFNKVPIIVAHDIAKKQIRHLDDVYGYGRIVIPENYVEIYISSGMGTAVWIKKDPVYLDLIIDMQNYSLETCSSK